MTGLVPMPPNPDASFTLAVKYRVYMDWLKRRLYNRIFPIPLRSLWFSLLVMVVAHSADVQWVRQGTAVVESCLLPVIRLTLVARLLSICAFTLVLWVAFVFSVRCAITCALMYKGYLSETPGKVSLSTKLFMGFVQVLWKCKPRFMSFQTLLPAQPVPAVSSTVEQYLETVRPLLSDEEFAAKRAQADTFLAGPAGRLQRTLRLKWLTSTNYVTDWWKEFAYLKWDYSLINTQCAGLDVIYRSFTHRQAARAGTIVCLHQKFLIDGHRREHMKPISLAGVPMCNQQYVWVDRNLRRAGPDGDACVPAQRGRHIAVYHRGCWHALPAYHGKRMFRPAEFEVAFQRILDGADKAEPVPGESHLSALTLCNRRRWHRVRQQHFAEGLNKESVEMIESAMDVVFFDDEDFEHDENDIGKLERWYRRVLTADGYKAWADLPATTIVARNGKFMASGEHSALVVAFFMLNEISCDALINVHNIEYYKYHETHNPHFAYSADGHANGLVEHVPEVVRLQWSFTPDGVREIEAAYDEARAVADNVTNAAMITTDLGKAVIKRMEVSPDAFIQMALQLAYYRDQQKFGLTYESSMSRLFREGRTDTVRTVTPQSIRFVRAMDGHPDGTTDANRLSLLRQACSTHQAQVRRAMCGQACDRHLFALYIAAKGTGVESAFLQDALAQPWKLSTSQTPQNQMMEHRKQLNADPTMFWPAGGFMAPAGSDYGVCYTIGECGQRLSFHITAHASDAHTDPQRFRDTLRSCLMEMTDLYHAQNER